MVVLSFLSGCIKDKDLLHPHPVCAPPGDPGCIPRGAGVPGGPGGSVNPGPATGTTTTVTITYKVNANGVNCPDSADTKHGAPGDDIEFMGVAGEQYWITFDPFIGAKHRSTRNGQLTLRLNNNSLLPVVDNPAGESYTFKYTILARNCLPYDPEIIIDR